METSKQDTLIERYLAAVSENLPARLRSDTVTEIRSLIQDALDDRSKKEGREPDDEMMAAVLKEFGSPDKIVAPYLPEKYLIGPRLYPTFILVLEIALPIIAVLVLVASMIGANLQAPITAGQIFTRLIKSVADSVSAVAGAFGNIVLIFAILQWVLPEFKLGSKEKEWDPHSLKAISQPDRIKRAELIVEIAFTLVALIIFNFYFERVGIYTNTNGQWFFTAILTTAFTTYLPWLDLLWVLTIILDVLVVRKGAWQTGTRLFAIVNSALTIGIAASLMPKIPYLYTLKGALGELGGEGILQSVLNQVLIVVLVIVIISSVVKIGQMAWRLVRSRLPVLEIPTK